MSRKIWRNPIRYIWKYYLERAIILGLFISLVVVAIVVLVSLYLNL